MGEPSPSETQRLAAGSHNDRKKGQAQNCISSATPVDEYTAKVGKLA